MPGMMNRSGLSVDTSLIRFVEDRALPGTGISADTFWHGLADIMARFAPENAALLTVRDQMQAQIDDWHDAHAGQPLDPAGYQTMLRNIGYLQDEPDPFMISTSGVDPEVATIAGPQLVVPALNARFVLNAANARWGSLYDALYGTDALGDLPAGGGYDPARGARVVARAKAFLDEAVPLASGSWSELGDPSGGITIADPTQCIGETEKGRMFRHNGLHVEVIFDRHHPVGATDPSGIADVVLESALTAIVDLEDSVAAVDAADKVAGYANWLGLMQGTLTERFDKGGQVITRRLASDRIVRTSSGDVITLPGRALLFVRNVGHLMTTPAVRLPDGRDAPEGLLDAVITSLAALHDINGPRANSRAGSIYIVKPKMHGPAECAFTNRLFDEVEDMLGLSRHTIKVGVMDEERRTSANLAACIHAVRGRIAFINTGFLDRTGDEIHTSMRAGPMVRKGAMKRAEWIAAYEDRNVQIGLACGLSGKAQIGKGMWAMPDRMADMLAQKGVHPMSGANTAWVPSPTAATLHALHYHTVDVFARQAKRRQEAVAPLSALLTIPLAHGQNWSSGDITQELDNNVQGILGYVVRWIDQGIGCSKVPDIHDIGLMEDRATLRISAQHIANWLMHDVCTAEQVDAAFSRMAAKVDAQNADDPLYRPLTPDGPAMQAARALVFEGAKQPSGYTEPLLHHWRAVAKAAMMLEPDRASA